MTTQLTADILQAVTTGSTCGFACWEAREHTCRCSCGGRNHGILRDPNAKQPDRTCKMGGIWYKLHSIGGRDLAMAECGELREREQDGKWSDYYKCYIIHTSKPGDKYHCKAATAAQCKWPEVKAMGLAMPYIIWKRVDAQKAA